MVTSNEIQVFDCAAGRLSAQTRDDGVSIFKVIDACRILGLGNPTEALRGLDDDEKMTLRNSEGHSGRRAPTNTWVTESGLYALIFKSRKAEAKRFRKWVTSEVLPALRKTGSYSIMEAQVKELKTDCKMAQLELVFADLHCADLEEQISRMQPSDSDYMTLRDFCARFRVYDDLGRVLRGPVLRYQWRLLALVSKHKCAEVRSAFTVRHSKVNTYRLDVLREWSSLFQLRINMSEVYRDKIRKAIGL